MRDFDNPLDLPETLQQVLVKRRSSLQLRLQGHQPQTAKPGVSIGCGSKLMGSHFGLGAPPIVHFRGDWDHWGYGLLTHGQFNTGHHWLQSGPLC